MAKSMRCRLGKHQWRIRKSEEHVYYWCPVCGKKRDKPPKPGSGGAEAPFPPQAI